MRTFTSPEELNKVLRQIIITQSELPADRVLNALSFTGTELDKLLQDSIYSSIEHSDTTLLFELMNKPGNSNVSSTNKNSSTGEIEYIKEQRLKIIIYGSDSSLVALKLVSRLRTAEVRTLMRDAGVYYSNVSEPDTLNEYKNETMWLRNDISIDVVTKYIIQPISSDTNFENINLTIIRGGEK